MSYRTPRPALLALLAAALIGGQARAQEESARLDALKADIEALEREIARQIGRRDDGAAELRAIELEVAEARAGLREIAARIAAQSAREAEIGAERAAAARRLADEEAALGEQLRLSYMTGNAEIVKLVLSQESPADFGRMLVYYDYLNRHRGERIEAVDAELARLEALEQESRTVAAELERLRADQQQELARLESAQDERLALVRELDASIEASGSRVERLRAEEAALNETIARLARMSEGFPVTSEDPFSAQKGKLRWPVDGRPVVSFGDFRDEARTLRWEGVMLEAATGTTVRAVYTGRVRFSGWLQGWGLMLIVDHGEDFWTLYGHNSALLRETGDWVEPGEAIAEVGDSGGQAMPGLYFAIRRDGKPVDPADWVR